MFCAFQLHLNLIPVDVADLQNFVTVALNNASSGEDTLTNAKLASLCTVANGFGYLIYDLKRDADFDTLYRQCTLVWECMLHTPNLLQCLVIRAVYRIHNHIDELH